MVKKIKAPALIIVKATVTDSLRKRIKIRAIEEGISAQDVIIKAIESYLERVYRAEDEVTA